MLNRNEVDTLTRDVLLPGYFNWYELDGKRAFEHRDDKGELRADCLVFITYEDSSGLEYKLGMEISYLLTTERIRDIFDMGIKDFEHELRNRGLLN